MSIQVSPRPEGPEDPETDPEWEMAERRTDTMVAAAAAKAHWNIQPAYHPASWRFDMAKSCTHQPGPVSQLRHSTDEGARSRKGTYAAGDEGAVGVVVGIAVRQGETNDPPHNAAQAGVERVLRTDGSSEIILDH